MQKWVSSQVGSLVRVRRRRGEIYLDLNKLNIILSDYNSVAHCAEDPIFKSYQKMNKSNWSDDV